MTNFTTFLSRLFSPQPKEAAPAPAPVAAPAPFPIPVTAFPSQPTTYLSLSTLTAMLRAVGFFHAETWAVALHKPMRAADITTKNRMAIFLANCAHETGGGQRLSENLRYSAKRLTEVWPSRFPTIEAAQPFAWDPADEDAEDVKLANSVYGSRMGNQKNGTNDDDGWLYRGRGLIQVTGRDNYAALGLEDRPDWVATWEGAAVSACRYWQINRLNDTADKEGLRAVRKRVNGGLIGIDDVERRYAAAIAVP